MLIEILQAPSTMVLNASCNMFRSQDHAVAGLFGLLHTVVQPSVHHRLQYHGHCRVHCRLCRLRVPVRILLSPLQVELAFRKTAFFLPAPSVPFWIWSEARSSSYRCVSKFNRTMAESNVMDQVWLCSGERDSFLLRTSCQESARVARSLDLPRRSRD